MIMCHLVCVGLYLLAPEIESVKQSIGQANARDEYSKEQMDNSSVLPGKWREGVSSGRKYLSMSRSFECMVMTSSPGKGL